MSSESTYPPPPELPRFLPLHLEPEPVRRVRMRLVDLTVSIPSTNSKTPLDEAKPPERWKTLEFRIYMVVACIVLPIMAWIPISLSSCVLFPAALHNLLSLVSGVASHPNYPMYKARLSPGWIPFRKVVSTTSAVFINPLCG